MTLDQFIAHKRAQLDAFERKYRELSFDPKNRYLDEQSLRQWEQDLKDLVK